MPVANGLLTLRYDEIIQPGRPRLGRHMELDARSLAHVAAQAVRIAPKSWDIPIPVLDQGELGSCVGNAGTAHVAQVWGAAYGRVTLGEAGLTGDPRNDELFAVELYHEATVRDGFPGDFPPDDTGSSGLGVCRALKAGGLVDSYVWATSLRGLASLLQHGTAMVGMPWYEAFFAPDAAGFIDRTGWDRTPVAGGHELCAEALESWSEHDPDKAVLRFRNSWGPSWGDHGSFRMRGATYRALLHQVDAKQGRRG